MTHAEYLSAESARFLAEIPESGPLAEFVRQVERDCQETLDRDDRGSRFGILRYFPHGLFGRVSIGGREYVATRAITTPFMFGREPLTSISDVSPDDAAVDRATSALWGLFSRQTVVLSSREEDDPPGDTAAIDSGISLSLGVDDGVTAVLRAAGESLSRCSIGVSSVRCTFAMSPHQKSERGPVLDDDDLLVGLREGKSLLQLIAETEGKLLSPRLEWLDESTGTWRTIEEASLGQLQVMLLMLRLQTLLREDVRRAGHAFILGDEFDRHLHPDATKSVLTEIQRIVQDAERLTVVLSTHSVQPLGLAPLAGIQRIYAEQTAGQFTYTGSVNALRTTVEDVLGTSTLDAWKLKRLHVLMEGLHDVLVVDDLISNQIPEIRDVNLVNGNGVNGWGGIFANLLRFVEAPVLLVYDKRNAALQDAWEQVRQTIIERGQIPNWKKTPLARLLAEVKGRTGKDVQPGDHELRQVLTVLQKSVMGSRDVTMASQVHLYGLEREDVVDYLPFGSFPRALEYGTNWAEVRTEIRRRFGAGYPGEKFKTLMGIDEKSVKRAIADNVDVVDPELAELIQVIRRLVSGQERSR